MSRIHKLLPRIVIIAALLSTAYTYAQDVAVLCDISGSMGHGKTGSSPYTQEFREALARLTSGGGVDMSRWHLTIAPTAPEQIKILLSGSGGSVGRYFVLRFGKFNRRVFPRPPYFEISEIHKGADTAQQLAAAFPTDAPDPKTNKELAMAGMARYLYDTGSTHWMLMTVSDFDEDASSEAINPVEQQVIDDFNSSTVAERSKEVAVLRWASNPRLQVRIEYDRRTHGQKPTENEDRGMLLRAVYPVTGARIAAGKPVTFSWVWQDPSDKPARYRLVVTPAGGGSGGVRAETALSSSTTKLAPGRYTWQVFAQMHDASSGDSLVLSTRPIDFEVEGQSWLLWLLVLPLLAVAVFYSVRKYNDLHAVQPRAQKGSV